MQINIQTNGRGPARQPETPAAVLLRILVNGLAVCCTSYLLSGVHVDNILTALLVSCALAVLNAFVRPLLILLTIPLTLFSFGLFLIVINALIILLATDLVPHFHIDGFWWAVAFSLVLWIVNSFFERIRKNLFTRTGQQPGDQYADYIEIKEEQDEQPPDPSS